MPTDHLPTSHLALNPAPRLLPSERNLTQSVLLVEMKTGGVLLPQNRPTKFAISSAPSLSWKQTQHVKKFTETCKQFVYYVRYPHTSVDIENIFNCVGHRNEDNYELEKNDENRYENSFSLRFHS